MYKEKISMASNLILTRVSKTHARRLFNNGYTIYLCPSKCSVLSIFSSCIHQEDDYDATFDKMYNSFCFYNLGGELGQYVKCYVLNLD